jgi:hypothetical protein
MMYELESIDVKVKELLVLVDEGVVNPEMEKDIIVEAAIPLEDTALVIVIVPTELENERAHFNVD